MLSNGVERGITANEIEAIHARTVKIMNTSIFGREAEKNGCKEATNQDYICCPVKYN